MITVVTAGEFLAHRYQLRGHCPSCLHTAMVVLDALPADTILVGPERRRLRCSACGAADVDRTVVSPTWWSVGGSTAGRGQPPGYVLPVEP